MDVFQGKYPEVHGIVDNNMYDQNFRKFFCISCDNDPEWWEAEPVSQTDSYT